MCRRRFLLTSAEEADPTLCEVPFSDVREFVDADFCSPVELVIVVCDWGGSSSGSDSSSSCLLFFSFFYYWWVVVLERACYEIVCFVQWQRQSFPATVRLFGAHPGKLVVH